VSEQFFQQKINNLRKQNLYRQLKISDAAKDVCVKQNGKKYISFCSNDYLGLSQNKFVKNAAIKAINKYGFGAGASRYVTGNNSFYQKLEKKLSELKKTADAIVFGSGYLGAISVIPAIVSKNDLIIADKLIHSSLIDGARLSGAKMLRFQHNDMQNCEEILNRERKNYSKCLIITETVFSMDGDLGKIQELLDLALKYNCLLISDDAHGLGIISSKINSEKYAEFYLQMGTLSKAVGGYGGYISASKLIIDYLRNFAKSAIYSTALPPAVLAGNLKALKIIGKDKKLAKKCLNNAEYFCKILKLEKPKSAIVIVIIGDNVKTLEIAKKVSDYGFLISAIRPPTVESGKSRLRITFSALHKKNDIKKLAEFLKKIMTNK
jgi:8-amino-7-oxononanoate synthase